MTELSEMDWILRRKDLSQEDAVAAALYYLRWHGRTIGYDRGGDHMIDAADLLENALSQQAAPQA